MLTRPFHIILFLVLLLSASAMTAQRSDLLPSSSNMHEGFKGQADLKVATELFHAFTQALRSKEGHSVKHHLQQTEDPRAVAIGLTVLLGPFGAHRIYLGTHEMVPVFYTLTLGGGLGVIPVIDLLHLIFKKDISPFVNNPKVLMWGGK